MHQEILKKVCDCVRQHSDFDGEVTPQTKFYGEGIDSLEVVDIVMECEKVFEVKIMDSVLYDNTLTVSDLVGWIEAELLKKK